ncbi:hypothetical protein BH10PLA1_BH10PLA1_19840 [soil metagenome]
MFSWLKNANNTNPTRAFRKNSGLAVIAFGMFWCGFFVNTSLKLSSQLFGAAFFAALFTTINVAFGFPIAMLAGFVIRWLAEKILRRPMPARIVLPWIIPIGVGLVACAMSFSGRSGSALFQRFLDTAMPPSVTGIEYWWTTAPGDVPFALKFKIDPRDFKKLLVGHTFTEIKDREERKMELNRWFPSAGFFSPSVTLPALPLTRHFKYENEPGEHTPIIINVFTTDQWNEVIVCGDYM